MSKVAKRVSLLLIMVVLLSGFGWAFSQTAATAEAAGTGLSRVRVAHLSPDAPNVDVYVDGSKTLTNVPFKTVSGYLTIASGSHRFEVRPAGASASSTAVIDVTTTLDPTKDYTVAATNFVASITGRIYIDENNKPAPGKAKVRVIHASPDAPNVDVVVRSGPTLISNLPFGSASNYLEVAAGTYNLDVRAAGTTTVALALSNTVLEAGKVYTVIAADRLSSITAVVTTLDGNPGVSRVRVAHLSPDAPNVDVYVDASKVLSNVPFKTISGYLTVPSGTHRFEVRPAGAAASTTAVIDVTATLEPSKNYTVAATNLLASITGRLYADNNDAPASGKAKVRVLHASPDAPNVDVAVTSGPVLISNLPFGSISNDLEVTAGTYNLEVRAAGTTTVALALPNTVLEAGKVYTVIAADRLASITALVTVLPQTGTYFHAVPSARLYDSRSSGGTKLAAGATRQITVGGVAGIPTTATSVIGNLTVTNPTAGGYLSLFPGTTWPGNSSINWNAASESVANFASVGLQGGKFTARNSSDAGSQPVDFIFDVIGYLDNNPNNANYLTPITPFRAYDSRTAGGVIAAGGSRDVNINSTAIPAGATAAIVNLTVANTTGAGGYLSVYPKGTALPPENAGRISSINWNKAGEARANFAIVPLSADRSLTVYASNAGANFILDVVGYVSSDATGQNFTLLTPTRVYDSRTTDGPLNAEATRTNTIAGVGGVPATAKAVLVNLTVANQSGSGYVSLYPGDATIPALADRTSSINWSAANQATANLVVVPLDSLGRLKALAGESSTQYILDVVGYVS